MSIRDEIEEALDYYGMLDDTNTPRHEVLEDITNRMVAIFEKRYWIVQAWATDGYTHTDLDFRAGPFASKEEALQLKEFLDAYNENNYVGYDVRPARVTHT